MTVRKWPRNNAMVAISFHRGWLPPATPYFVYKEGPRMNRPSATLPSLDQRRIKL
jgi:hypothetical protein